MSRYALVAIPLFIMGLTSAHAESSRNYELTGFDKIEAAAGLNVSIQHAVKHNVEVTAKKSNYFDKLEIVLQGETLMIKRKRDWGVTGLISWAQNWTNDVQVRIEMPILTEVEASSGATLRINRFEMEYLSLEASSGASVQAIDIKAGKISMDASSGASVHVNGTCEQLEAEASSGASVLANNLICDSGELDVSSGGTIQANLTDVVRADASSGGSIHVDGNPKTIESEQSSGASINISK